MLIPSLIMSYIPRKDYSKLYSHIIHKGFEFVTQVAIPCRSFSVAPKTSPKWENPWVGEGYKLTTSTQRMGQLQYHHPNWGPMGSYGFIWDHMKSLGFEPDHILESWVPFRLNFWTQPHPLPSVTFQLNDCRCAKKVRWSQWILVVWPDRPLTGLKNLQKHLQKNDEWCAGCLKIGDSLFHPMLHHHFPKKMTFMFIFYIFYCWM